MQQHTIKPADSQTKKRKRVGRGNAAGQGTYCGRGLNGQNSRSGGKRRPGFEGGQTPLIKRMPKLPGFRHPHADQKAHQPVNLADLETNFNDGDTVTKEDLKAKGLIVSTKRPVKILGQGKLTKKLTVSANAASASAQAAVEKAGGKLDMPAKPENKVKKDKKSKKASK